MALSFPFVSHGLFTLAFSEEHNGRELKCTSSGEKLQVLFVRVHAMSSVAMDPQMEMMEQIMVIILKETKRELRTKNKIMKAIGPIYFNELC